jgi:hypothetical protein
MTDLPEKEHISSAEGLQKEATGQSEGLPREVSSAGVSIHPSAIPIPKPLIAMGVKPAGSNVPPPPVNLPITDDQIAQGLSKSVRESFRWLSEWCLRRLKQVHIGLNSIHGRLTRTQIK